MPGGFNTSNGYHSLILHGTGGNEDNRCNILSTSALTSGGGPPSLKCKRDAPPAVR